MQVARRSFIAGVAGAGLLLAGAAHAQAVRTWVSGVGDDANPCSRTAPCKTFAGAISKTAAGGEISVLDPGGYGAVTITKAISITNDNSGEAGILASNTNGVTINAGANDVINLRGLIIDGGPPTTPGRVGIRFIGGGALHIQNVVIKNFAAASPNGLGILFAPAGASRLYVSDTVISNNGTAANGGGILVKPTGTGSARAFFSNVKVNGNGFGIVSDGAGSAGPGISLVVHDSMVAGNLNVGIAAVVPVGGQGSNIMIDRVATVANGTGVRADGSATGILLGGSTVTLNGTGLSTVNGGSIFSYGTNNINNNAVDGAATSTMSQN